ncbi:MAG TPA: phosphopantetheine-binding protein [Thermoanaerobaculia bacterium]|jgi:acyl carrier protein|nr:phosphopantetheine-binding protein [Thermoanaerobaculia bacterium]
MHGDEVRSQLKEIIASVAGLSPGKIGDHATLRDDLNLDSLSLLEIGVDVDFTFKLNLPDESYRGIESLDELVELVLGRLAELAHPPAHPESEAV